MRKKRQQTGLAIGEILLSPKHEVFQIIDIETEPVYILKDLNSGSVGKVKLTDIEDEGLVLPEFPSGKAKCKNKKNTGEQKAGSKSKSPYPGVYSTASKTNPWQARINKNGVKWSGMFETAEDARDALAKKYKELGLTPGHKKKRIVRARYKCKVCGAGFASLIRVCTHCNGDVHEVEPSDAKTEAMDKAIDFED